jgi:two-component system, chemotaxis family, chemotaxis protein CheY
MQALLEVPHMTEEPNRTAALVADPSSHMAALAAVMLRSLGIRNVEATVDLKRTAAELLRHPYGLILIDEQLGGEAGYAMIRKIRQTGNHPNRETPIIMMASAPDARMIAAARDAGVTEFLRKPFSAEHIGLRLNAIKKAPRAFVETGEYAGPDRRRRAVPGAAGRRASDKQSAGG